MLLRERSLSTASPKTGGRSRSGVLLIVFSMAALTLLMRAALQSWPLGLAGVLSRIVAVVLLGLWLLTTGRGWQSLRPNGVGKWLVVMCLFSAFVNFAVFLALEWTTATNHAILYRLDTVFVVLLGGLLGLEKISSKELILLPVMLLGMALVAEIGLSGLEVHWAGDLLVISAAAGFAINAFVNRHIVQTMEPGAMAIYNVVSGSSGFVTVSIVRGEWIWLIRDTPSVGAWFLLVLLGLLIAGFVPLYYSVLKRMPVWKLRTWMLVAPLLVAVADWFLWGTRLSPWQWLGAGLLLGGLAALIQLERHDQAACPEEVKPMIAEEST